MTEPPTIADTDFRPTSSRMQFGFITGLPWVFGMSKIS
ncbi:MAG: hypothetical protein ACI8PT_000016 [Gammaproteobacteria bacterium]|jgi:hypothetical protein